MNQENQNKISSAVFLFTLSLLIFSAQAEGARLNHERFYQEEWCGEHKGIIEHILPDKTRVDCLLHDYAVEVAFSGKHHQALGQSLFHAQMTGRFAGVLLIMEHPEQEYK